MATKSPEATIDFLLMCLECTEGKTDWDKVAVKTGWYKAGKFSRQAFIGIQKKYGGIEIGGANADNAGNPTDKPKKTTTKKRPAAAENGEAKAGSTKKAKKEENATDDEGENESGGASDA